MKEYFKKDGTYHRLIKVDLDKLVYLYELSYDELTVVGYSVMRCKVKLVPYSEDGDTYIAPPTSNQFGIHGWSYYNLCRAVNKFESLVGC